MKACNPCPFKLKVGYWRCCFVIVIMLFFCGAKRRSSLTWSEINESHRSLNRETFICNSNNQTFVCKETSKIRWQQVKECSRSHTHTHMDMGTCRTHMSSFEVFFRRENKDSSHCGLYIQLYVFSRSGHLIMCACWEGWAPYITGREWVNYSIQLSEHLPKENTIWVPKID